MWATWQTSKLLACWWEQHYPGDGWFLFVLFKGAASLRSLYFLKDNNHIAEKSHVFPANQFYTHLTQKKKNTTQIKTTISEEIQYGTGNLHRSCQPNIQRMGLWKMGTRCETSWYFSEVLIIQSITTVESLPALKNYMWERLLQPLCSSFITPFCFYSLCFIHMHYSQAFTAALQFGEVQNMEIHRRKMHRWIWKQSLLKEP